MEESRTVASPKVDAQAALRDIHDAIRIQATRVAEVQAALDAVRKELGEVRAQAAAREAALVLKVEELRNTRLYRWSIAPRRLYGVLRRVTSRRRGTA
jgi:hypothetical protein